MVQNIGLLCVQLHVFFVQSLHYLLLDEHYAGNENGTRLITLSLVILVTFQVTQTNYLKVREGFSTICAVLLDVVKGLSDHSKGN